VQRYPTPTCTAHALLAGAAPLVAISLPDAYHQRREPRRRPAVAGD
jgi:hypothetical protein